MYYAVQPQLVLRSHDLKENNCRTFALLIIEIPLFNHIFIHYYKSNV